jgi:hypothetical protein
MIIKKEKKIQEITPRRREDESKRHIQGYNKEENKNNTTNIEHGRNEETNHRRSDHSTLYVIDFSEGKWSRLYWLPQE